MLDNLLGSDEYKKRIVDQRKFCQTERTRNENLREGLCIHEFGYDDQGYEVASR